MRLLTTSCSMAKNYTVETSARVSEVEWSTALKQAAVLGCHCTVIKGGKMDRLSTVSWFCIGNVIGLIVLFVGVLLSSQKKHNEAAVLQKQSSSQVVQQAPLRNDIQNR
jgi:hypothetical protein